MALLDRIKYEGPPDILVWKYDKENIALGSQLIVNESQEALFYKEGQVLDVFTPGRYTLSSKNLPLLQKIVNLPFGGDTPFAAEVFYVNQTARLDYKWGTSKPIPIDDPVYRVLLSIGCHGQFGLRVTDSRLFVTNIVGTMPIWDGGRVLDYFQGLIINQVKTSVAEFVVKRGISVSKIAAFMDEVSQLVEERCRDEFAKYGLALLRFFVTSITIPETELKKIQEGAFERLKIEQIGDDRYRAKRMFDTLEKAAENEAAAGTLMSAGVGLGVGAKMAGGISNLADGAFGDSRQDGSEIRTARCPSCGAAIPTNSRFCSECGGDAGPPLMSGTCPACGKSVPGSAKFCPHCGKPAKLSCGGCGQELQTESKFCPNCGKSIGTESNLDQTKP